MTCNNTRKDVEQIFAPTERICIYKLFEHHFAKRREKNRKRMACGVEMNAEWTCVNQQAISHDPLLANY